MRVLIIKMSSMGDIIHTLPALSDAAKAIPNIQFDWVVEESFQSIPKWHTAVHNVIPVALRRWRKNWIMTFLKGQFFTFIKTLRSTKYDLIIDAQGLYKSSLLSVLARGTTAGLSWSSAREPGSSFGYRNKCSVPWGQHAVIRNRNLFAQALNYSLADNALDYGICIDRLEQSLLLNQQEVSRNSSQDSSQKSPYAVFLHGTTWPTKHWPESYWIELGKILNRQGMRVKLMWGNPVEEQRAKRIANELENSEVLPKLTLAEAAQVIAFAQGVISVDTGLGHLAAALNVPTISLYGPTDPGLSGTYGLNQIHLKSNFQCSPCFSKTCVYSEEKTGLIDPPCFERLPPEKVWEHLKHQLESNHIKL